MKIATVGAGNIGGTLGERWTKAGHEVVYGLRDPSKRTDAKPIGQALDGAEAVLLALPGSTTVDFVREHAKALDGANQCERGSEESSGGTVGGGNALHAFKPGDQVQVTWTDQASASHTATITLTTGPAI